MTNSSYSVEYAMPIFNFTKDNECLHIIKRSDGYTSFGITYHAEIHGEEDEDMSVNIKDEDVKVLMQFLNEHYGDK